MVIVGGAFQVDPNERDAFVAATGVIERSQWGITWNAPLANGAFAVGERVKLTLHVEASLQA